MEQAAELKVAVVGNCQGGVLADMLSSLPKEPHKFVSRHIIAYMEQAEGDKEFINSADIILYQSHDFQQKNAATDLIEFARGRRIDFPLLAGHFLYPFHNRSHPLNASSKTVYAPNGFHDAQTSDSRLIKLMEAHPEADAAFLVDRYLAEDFSELIDLDRLMEIDRHRTERLGNEAGLNLWPLIERNFRDHPLFWTYGHPADLLLKPLCCFVLESMDIGLSAQQINDHVDEFLKSHTERLSATHAPIHPSVVNHFGITWAHPHHKYLQLFDGAFDRRTFWERFVRFEHSGALFDAVYQMRQGQDLAEVLASLKKVSETLPGSPSVHSSLANVYAVLGRRQEALESAISAVLHAPDRRQYVTQLCTVARAVTQLATPSPQVFDAGQTYKFSDKDKESRSALLAGWQSPEPWGVWSDGANASMRIVLSSSPGEKVHLGFGLLAFVPDETNGLTVEVWVNCMKHAIWRFDYSGHPIQKARKSLVNVSSLTTAGKEHINILFKIKKPFSPASAGMNLDPRELGIGVQTLFLARAGQAI